MAVVVGCEPLAFRRGAGSGPDLNASPLADSSRVMTSTPPDGCRARHLMQECILLEGELGLSGGRLRKHPRASARFEVDDCGRLIDVLGNARNRVGSAVTSEPVVHMNDPLTVVASIFAVSRNDALPVVDDAGFLRGCIGRVI